MVTTVVGLGFVGLTTALGFAEHGHRVYGLEADPKRLSTIQGGKLPFLEPGLDQALIRHLGKDFIPTSNWNEAICNSEIIYFCVGTPYGPNGQSDLTALFEALRKIVKAISDDRFRVLVIKSTIPPSSTQDRIIPFVKSLGKCIPEQLGIANNPEFLREGHCWEDVTHPDRIVFGIGDVRSEQMLRALYKEEKAPICCVSFNTAEYIKYLSNTVLACLISFSNEMSMAADAIGGIDIANAFRILHMDKRWQSGGIRSYFYPGCGYGGYCLPKDTNAFYALEKSAGFDGKILCQVISTNDSMPEYAAKRIMCAANGNKMACIGILGLSFNPGSDDVRDTPSAKIIELLNRSGFQNILAYDPIAINGFQSQYHLNCRFASYYDQILKAADILVITTAWEQFGDLKSRTEKPIVDLRYML